MINIVKLKGTAIIMKKFSKPRIFVIAMSDNTTGETVGESIESLYDAGACNVQVISTITKKNRPGYMYVIDCDSSSVDRIEDILVTEVGTTGWHRMDSEHCYTELEYLTKKVKLVKDGRTVVCDVRCKYSPNVPEKYRIERDSLDGLTERVRSELGASVSRQRLANVLVRAFEEEDSYIIEI